MANIKVLICRKKDRARGASKKSLKEWASGNNDWTPDQDPAGQVLG